MQLEATAEYIPLGAELDLNRDNLIVICGPRLSPVVHEVLQSDPVLGFDQDDAGRWLLQDRRAGERYPSPSDLPQPDLAPAGGWDDNLELTRRADAAGAAGAVILAK